MGDQSRELDSLRAQVARLTRILVRWADEDMRRADYRLSIRDLVTAAGKGDKNAVKKLEVML